MNAPVVPCCACPSAALPAQLLHLALCIVWNGIGLWQIARGVPSIGPTASWAAIGMSVLLGAALWHTARRGPVWLYLLLSAVTLMLALAAIWGGFTKDASNGPSEFWRWAGIAVNAIGVIGFLLAVKARLRRH